MTDEELAAALQRRFNEQLAPLSDEVPFPQIDRAQSDEHMQGQVEGAAWRRAGHAPAWSSEDVDKPKSGHRIGYDRQHLEWLRWKARGKYLPGPDGEFSFHAEHVSGPARAFEDLLQTRESARAEAYRVRDSFESVATVTDSRAGAVCPSCRHVNRPPQGNDGWFDEDGRDFEIDCEHCGEEMAVLPIPPSGGWLWRSSKAVAS